MARKSVNLLPAYYRSEKNSKFLSSTIDQLIQTPSLERLNGFVGSKLSKNYNATTDNYISTTSELRSKYQLEPGLVVKKLTQEISKVYGYDDLINQISYHKGTTDNLDYLFKSEFYSYDPQIEWDKLVNFRDYFWLPTGPSTVLITGIQKETVSTYNVANTSDGNYFLLTPDGLTSDPQLVLYRGVTYVFNINSAFKFYLKSTPAAGIQNLYNTNVQNNGTANGQIIFTVDYETPTVLYYGSDGDRTSGGQILVKTISENSSLDVERDIIGKKQYISGNNIKLVNGLKIRFGGNIAPSYYQDKEFIVEGVGDKIKLIDFAKLETPEFVAYELDEDFDVEDFDKYPFDNFQNVPLYPEYITINRSSKDSNSWSRYNRWFHKNVLEISSKSNNIDFVLPISSRAKRPIVEFKPDLQLYNFGNIGIKHIDLIDNITKDVFSNIEKSVGYLVDGVLLEEGFRVIFNADPDPYVKGRIFEVTFVDIDDKRVINLIEPEDNVPTNNSCVTVTRGEENKGTSWWFNNSVWVKGQQKTSLNQAPLFDLFDADGNSYSGPAYTSNFRGSKIFGYAVGDTYDSVLGFNLKYKNVGIESSYLFSNYFTTDEISFVYPDQSRMMSAALAYMKFNKDIENPSYVNIWVDAEEYQTPILQFETVSAGTENIEITCIDDPKAAYISNDLMVDLFINDVKQIPDVDYTIYILTNKVQDGVVVKFTNTISSDNTNILLKVITTQPANGNGIYEPPLSLTNNPFNGPISEFTLFELIDHANTMLDRDPEYDRNSSNMNELFSIGKYGTRLIVNKNPLPFAYHFIADKSNSLIEAIKLAADQYNQFKLTFIKTIAEISGDFTAPELLDIVLTKLNENKNTSFPHLLSGMVPYGNNKKVRTYTVTDPRNTAYSITNIYDRTEVNNKAILVYLNGNQLVFGKDYDFNRYDTTINIYASLTRNDVIEINEYLDTDGCYVPSTPTKLGLYPKFVPSIYTDTSYAYDPVDVIQGHDGSLIVAFGDYRDNVILELEKRIYNNIKTDYNPELLDINSVLPGVFRNSVLSYQQIYEVIQNQFLKWVSIYGIDYETNSTYDINNHKTYNYKSAVDYIFNKGIPGSWRAIFKYYFDTDRPDTHPWEMLGFSEQPDWWESEYGPKPYTSGNSRLWNDLELGNIAQGERAGINPIYARPGLSDIVPVNENGEIVDPRYWASMGQNDFILDTDQPWSFGDWSPAENAWRRSSNWPFAVQIILALYQPATYASALFDTGRIKKNKINQYVYSETGLFLSTQNLKLYGTTDSSGIIRSSGYSVYVVEAGNQRSTDYITTLNNELTHSNFNLVSKLGGFVSKDKLTIVIDAVQLGSYNPNPFLPAEDYSVFFNTSNPIKSLSLSGVIIQKSQGKYVIRGYDREDRYFKINSVVRQVSDGALSIGDNYESFINWSSNSYYQKGQVILYSGTYYRVLADHKSSAAFVKSYYQALNELPKQGGTSVIKSTRFEKIETIVNYGTQLSSTQEVADFLYGYGHWLESQGFSFDYFNGNFNQVINWEFSLKEFLYWSTQNWADNSVITLSPFAAEIKFNQTNSVVDNILDKFYGYSLLRADGKTFPSTKFVLSRTDGVFQLSTTDTYEGFYFIKLNLVQKEHVLVFNNSTVFSDVIYDIETGYRQRRVKLSGFRTAGWNGDNISPGFIYDDFSVSDWKSYVSYKPGEVVRYVDSYYSANKKVLGTEKFDYSYWTILPKKLEPRLLPNFDYKINEFENFYDLAADNFDLGQQRMSQHLVGFTPRPYLNNIFPNAISQYKFYQGFIEEKGTRNSITKLEKASLQNLQGKIDFTEEWAFRIGAYGSYSSFDQIEVPLREEEFVESNQIINFVDAVPAEPNTLISYVTPFDASIVPKNYDPTNTFPTTVSSFDTDGFVLKTAGYVRSDDVEYIITTSAALTATNNVNLIQEGDKFWIGFTDNEDWDVLRYTRQIPNLINVEDGKTPLSLIFTTDRYHGLVPGDIVGVTRFESSIDKVYKVTSVPSLNKFVVNSELASAPTSFSRGVLFKFETVRHNSFDDLASFKTIADIKSSELVWIDKDTNGKWIVYKKVDNFNKIEFAAPQDNNGQKYGYRLSKQQGNDTVLVSAPVFKDDTVGYGKIYVYTKTGGTLVPFVNFTLNEYVGEYTNLYRDIKETATFGDTLIFDETDDLVFASSPLSSNIKPDVSGDVRYARGTNAISPYQEAGLIKVSGIDRIRPYSEIPFAVLTNPSPGNRTHFGQGMFVSRTTSTKTLLVGAPGQNTSTGVVYRFTIDITETSKTYTGVSSTSTMGYGATFTVLRENEGYQVSIVNTGTSYNTASQILIYGNQLGGAHPRNDLVINVLSTGTNGGIVSFSSTGTSALRTFDVTAPSQKTLPIWADGLPIITGKAKFGHKIVGNKEGTLVAVSAPGLIVTGTNVTTATGAIYVYTLDQSTYKLVQVITSADPEYNNATRKNELLGLELAINELGTHLFVSVPNINDGVTRVGKVSVYKWNGSTFNFTQMLHNPSREPNLLFGQYISVNDDATILSITSQGTNQFNNVTFDGGRTVFDGDACSFGEMIPNSGTAFVYNRYQEKFVIAEELFDNTVDSGSFYGESVLVNDHEILVGSPGSISANGRNGSVYIWNEIDGNINSWEIYRQQEDVVDVYKIKNAATIDSFSNELVDYLDIIDPLKGRIPGLADQEIRYKTPFDPAVYEIGTDSVVVDATSKWSSEHVGKLWWDLGTTKFMWYEQGDLSYRKSTWGKLFPGTTIEVYEWVESSYLPSQWASLADTNEGLTSGISGQPKFIDDTVYSTKTYYNSVNSSFETRYYFWVKGKTVVPDITDRRISSYEVAQLIENPKSYGLKYISVISKDAAVVTNFKSSLIGERIYLNVSLDKINNKNKQHTEWLLIEENSENSFPNQYLERKLIDSLLGKDSLGNVVPDANLPVRLKYGIEVRPRQSMFVDRQKALRNAFDFINMTLMNYSVSGNINFDTLNSKESIPDEILGEWDRVLEDVESRDAIVTTRFKTATLTCIVENGKITAVYIIDPGYGYVVAPSVFIANNTSDAKITTTIDSNGQVIDVAIKNAGSNFVTAPLLIVRPYTVIVLSDPQFPKKWSKFEWFNSSWNRTHTQKYDTTKYWDYVDWVSNKYNPLKYIRYTVGELYELSTLDISIGDYIKVRNPGDNKFIIISKIDSAVSEGTFDKDYDLVYREKGTIQFSSALWNYTDSQLGFDQDATFDQTLYGETEDIELLNILTAVKEDIFSGPLRLYWNKFFFKCVKYAITEQRFVDWAFKTSFINVKNIAGVLDQRTTYRFQDSQWYEDYLKEVKPYHTKIRNYQINYQIGNSSNTYEPSNTFSTDFDLPVRYNAPDKLFETINFDSSYINEYPYKSWADNYTFEVESISISSHGSGYRTPPAVEIIPASGDVGSGATARAYIALGKITDIEVLTTGTGYTKTPTVLLVGGGDSNLVPAKAYANLTNKRVRSNLIGIKFDRITANTSTFSVTETTATDVIITTGVDYIYDLSWASTIDKSRISVTLNGIIVIASDYDIISKVDTSYGYHKMKSQISLAKIPARNLELRVTYSKNIEIYNAAERVRDYYNPSYGMPGKELAQLMSGAEYPGVQIEAQSFSDSAGWDALNFAESSWDSNVVTSQIETVLTKGISLAHTTASVASIDGMFIGQTLVIRDTLPIPTSITNIDLSTATFSLLTATSVASYTFTATGVTTYSALTATWTTATVYNTGSGALFTVSRQDFSNNYTVSLTNAGINYRVGTQVTITGDRLGGITPDNDLILRVLSTVTNFGISTIGIDQGVTSITSGTNIQVYRNNSSYTAIASSTGTNYTTSTTFTIKGNLLGGTTPSNDLVVQVTTVTNTINGDLIQINYTGTALAGSGAKFNVSRSNGVYNAEVSISNTGTGYNATVDAGSKLLITGNHLGGTTPDHDLEITVVSTGTNGRITEIAYTGVGVSPVITFDRNPISTTSTGYYVMAYSYITDDMDLDTIIDGGKLDYSNALGFGAMDIILDGDKFVSPYTSYGPEELVPGQVQESLSISVFTKAEQGSPIIVSQSYPVDYVGTATVIPLSYRPGNTSSVMVSFNQRSLVYSKDYSVDIYNKTITLNAQTSTGLAGIISIGVGGSKLLGTVSTSVIGVSSATVDTTALYADIKDVYVTVNGEAIPSSSTNGYTLSTVSSKNKRGRLTINGLSTGTNLIQSWFFASPHKAYSEVKEQILVGNGITTDFVLDQMPGNYGPLHAQAIVEIDGLRSLPPDTTYYSVENNQYAFDIDPEHTYFPGRFDLYHLEVHVNGIRIRNGIDYVLDSPNNTIIFDPGYLKNGDVLAITKLIENDYAILDNSIKFTTAPILGSTIKIVTYTNHDASFIRAETYHAHASMMYKLSRSVLDESYVWVSINGKPLINKQDFTLLDSQTVQIDKDYEFSESDKIEIMSFSDTTADKSVGFRVFKDILGRTHYKRYSEIHTTYLTQDLALNDTEIVVEDGSVLSEPSPSSNSPGIIFIAGERIEYMEKTGNVLGRIKRSTLGTGPKDLYVAGTPVVDHSKVQTVPSSGDELITQIITATNTTTYEITEISLDADVSPSDQLKVFYGGMLLSKSTSTVHNTILGFDSNENNSDYEVPPQFTISTGTTSTLVLSFVPKAGVRIKLVKSIGRIWYDRGYDTPSNGTSLLNSQSVQAKFLLEQQSGLPDKYQYGQI